MVASSGELCVRRLPLLVLTFEVVFAQRWLLALLDKRARNLGAVGLQWWDAKAGRDVLVLCLFGLRLEAMQVTLRVGVGVGLRSGLWLGLGLGLGLGLRLAVGAKQYFAHSLGITQHSTVIYMLCSP